MISSRGVGVPVWAGVRHMVDGLVPAAGGGTPATHTVDPDEPWGEEVAGPFGLGRSTEYQVGRDGAAGDRNDRPQAPEPLS